MFLFSFVFQIKKELFYACFRLVISNALAIVMLLMFLCCSLTPLQIGTFVNSQMTSYNCTVLLLYCNCCLLSYCFCCGCFSICCCYYYCLYYCFFSLLLVFSLIFLMLLLLLLLLSDLLVDQDQGFHFSGKKFPFWKWNDPEICCVNRNSGIIPV